MHYKYHLFMRGAKHFNPYMKRVLYNKLSHAHHSGGSLTTDQELLKMLGNISLKPGLHKMKPRRYGGAITHRKPPRQTSYKPLLFTR